mgnify:CR=1 FL=1
MADRRKRRLQYELLRQQLVRGERIVDQTLEELPLARTNIDEARSHRDLIYSHGAVSCEYRAKFNELVEWHEACRARLI